jgi:hypothetical protein
VLELKLLLLELLPEPALSLTCVARLEPAFPAGLTLRLPLPLPLLIPELREDPPLELRLPPELELWLPPELKLWLPELKLWLPPELELCEE